MARFGAAALIGLLVGISSGWATGSLLWGANAPQAGLGVLGCTVFAVVAIMLVYSFGLKHGWIKPRPQQWADSLHVVRSQYQHWEAPEERKRRP